MLILIKQDTHVSWLVFGLISTLKELVFRLFEEALMSRPRFSQVSLEDTPVTRRLSIIASVVR